MCGGYVNDLPTGKHDVLLIAQNYDYDCLFIFKMYTRRNTTCKTLDMFYKLAGS